MASSSKPLPPNAEDLVFGCLESDDPRAALERICDERPEEAEAYRAIFSSLQRHGLLRRARSPSASEAAGRPEKLGPYRILEKLGHGGMGVVFLGMDETLGRKVAIKLIRPEQLYVPGNKARFKREVDALLDLSHPGIVRVLGAGEDQGIPYYAMEFVEGLSLAEAIQSLGDEPPSKLDGKCLLPMLEKSPPKGTGSSSGNNKTRLTDEFARLSWPDLCIRIAAEAAEALQHAHEQQVIHRDVKPSNLLLTRSGHLRLVDFGLARIEDGQSLTGSTAELGSLPYMPPEYLGGAKDRVDPRQDVYSLGVTLYELLTLHCPYLGKNQEETRRLILEANPPDPRKLNPRISWELATVCLTAMDPDPARRYQTCADLLHDLSNLRSRQPILATRPKPLLRLRRWAERHPRTSAVLATGTVLVLLSGFLYGLSESKARRQIETLYEQARYLNYIANIRTAKMDIATDEVADGKFRLLSCPEDLRGMEWNILDRRMDQSLRILSRGTLPVVDLALSDDGQMLASADLNGQVRVIRVRDATLVSLLGLTGQYLRLGFLTDSHQLTLGQADGTVRIFDIDENRAIAELRETAQVPARANALRHLPDLGLLAVAYSDGWIRLWDIPSRSLRSARQVHTSTIQGLSVNAASTLLISSSMDDTAKLLTLPDLVEKLSVAHANWVLAATFTRHGKAFLSSDQLGGVIETDIDSGVSRELTPGQRRRSCAAQVFLPKRRELIKGRVAVVSQNIDESSMSQKQLGHQSTILCLAVAPSQERLYTGGEDGTIREWGVQAQGMTRTLADVRNAVRAVGWMDSTRWIAGNSKGKLLRGTLLDSASPKVTELKGGGILDLAPLSTHDFAVSTAENGIAFFRWDEEQAYQWLPLDSPAKTIQAAGEMLLVLTRKGTILELRRNEDQWRPSALDWKAKVSTMAQGGAQGRIFWAGEDGILHVTDPVKGQSQVLHAGEFQVKKIRPLGNSQQISIEDADHVIRVLDARTSRITHVFTGHTRELDSVAMPADTKRLVSSGKHERKLMIWDTANETRLLSIELPHTSLDMALDPSGQKILLGLMWGYVVLCDASPTDRPLELTTTTRSTLLPSVTK